MYVPSKGRHTSVISRSQLLTHVVGVTQLKRVFLSSCFILLLSLSIAFTAAPFMIQPVSGENVHEGKWGIDDFYYLDKKDEQRRTDTSGDKWVKYTLRKKAAYSDSKFVVQLLGWRPSGSIYINMTFWDNEWWWSPFDSWEGSRFKETLIDVTTKTSALTTTSRTTTPATTSTYTTKPSQPPVGETFSGLTGSILKGTELILTAILSGLLILLAAIVMRKRKTGKTPTASVTFCVSCGTRIPIDMKFCPKCGEKKVST